MKRNNLGKKKIQAYYLERTISLPKAVELLVSESSCLSKGPDNLTCMSGLNDPLAE